MNKFIRLYNQNRYMFWICILIIVAIIVIIHILDEFAYNKKIVEQKNNISTNINFNKNYSVITGSNLNKETSTIIDEFINYCNNRQIKMAYELLSNECKEVLYPSLDDFEKKYYNRIFNTQKKGIYQAWKNYYNKFTYKMDFIDDILATGEISKYSISDYYTVIKDNDKYKLNINNFIGVEKIDRVVTRNNISIKVNRKKIYMDYEIYQIEVNNNTEYDIMLDDLLHVETIYLEDNQEQKFCWYNNEFVEDEVLVKKENNLQLEIKFNKKYRPEEDIVKIVFSNIKINNKDTIEIQVLI